MYAKTFLYIVCVCVCIYVCFGGWCKYTLQPELIHLKKWHIFIIPIFNIDFQYLDFFLNKKKIFFFSIPHHPNTKMNVILSHCDIISFSFFFFFFFLFCF